MSNNVAEYAALCEALKFVLTEGRTRSPIEVRSDSKLLVHQMGGNWRFHRGLYAEKYHEATRLRKEFTNLEFKWIPRKENQEADALSREAYERSRDKLPTPQGL